MDRQLRYHPLFECDVREAADWYSNRSDGLGEAFIAQVESRIADVIAQPDRFAKTSTGCRYVRIPRFPHILLFELLDHEIIFLGVMHTARSADKWRQRQAED